MAKIEFARSDRIDADGAKPRVSESLRELFDLISVATQPREEYHRLTRSIDDTFKMTSPTSRLRYTLIKHLLTIFGAEQ